MRHRTFLLVTSCLLMVGACGGEAADESTTLGSPTTTALVAITTEVTSPTTTALAATSTVVVSTTAGLPEAVSYGPATLVSGEEMCELTPMIAEGTTTVDPDGTIHIRDAEFKCTVTNSDPRIAGTATYTANLDRWTRTGADGVQFQWGTIRIENEGGAWDTDYIGIFSPETGDVGAELYTGTGDYEGLYYYQWVFETFGQPWPTRGLIFPDTVPVPGA